MRNFLRKMLYNFFLCNVLRKKLKDPFKNLRFYNLILNIIFIVILPMFLSHYDVYATYIDNDNKRGCDVFFINNFRLLNFLYEDRFLWDLIGLKQLNFKLQN